MLYVWTGQELDLCRVSEQVEVQRQRGDSEVQSTAGLHTLIVTPLLQSFSHTVLRGAGPFPECNTASL